MIIEEYIEILITSTNLTHYKNKGYDVKYKQYLTVNTLDLMKNSNYEILVRCSCGNEHKIKMRTYTKSLNKLGYYCCSNCSYEKIKITNLEKYGVEQTFQCDLFLEKRKKNNLEKYGVETVSQIYAVKEKIKETNLEKFGFDSASQHQQTKDKMKNTRIQKGLQLPDDKINDFILYKRKVWNITKKYKKILIENWNGLDYYDNECIKDNFMLSGQHSSYPSVDHKISIFYGFNNNISVETIASIENLCITKNSLNSLKNIRTEEEFRKYLENK